MNTDPITGKDLSELGFDQKVIHRIPKNQGGYQEFKIKIDKEKRYEINEEGTRTDKERENEYITQSYELPGNFDITTRKIRKDAMHENQTDFRSEAWEYGMRLQRVLSERGLECWICRARIREEIGAHVAQAHHTKDIWKIKPPYYIKGVQCT